MRGIVESATGVGSHVFSWKCQVLNSVRKERVITKRENRWLVLEKSVAAGRLAAGASR